jgi:hypothetical protein
MYYLLHCLDQSSTRPLKGVSIIAACALCSSAVIGARAAAPRESEYTQVYTLQRKTVRLQRCKAKELMLNYAYNGVALAYVSKWTLHLTSELSRWRCAYSIQHVLPVLPSSPPLS